MTGRIEEIIEGIWVSIEEKMNRGAYTDKRIYQRLDLERETDIRLGFVKPDGVRELLVQLSPTDKTDFFPPKWVGMKSEIILMDAPERGTRHIRLFMDKPEHREVFTVVCSDIIDTLLKVVKPEHRTIQLLACMEKWGRFFQKHGIEGLSNEAQRGLYGELYWLYRLLTAGMDRNKAMESWMGCRRAYHDFEHNGKIIEVKTTISKEPRRVRINNEKQLDDRGFAKLTLYVLTLDPTQTGGQRLPDLVKNIRSVLSGFNDARDIFELCLQDAGYLDLHDSLYDMGYNVRKEETFKVMDGFPRIIDLPSGTGDISYSLVLSACQQFIADPASVISEFIKGESLG